MQPTKNLDLIPTRFPSVFNIRLSLEHETRWIAKIDLSGGGTLMIKRTAKHLFRRTNSLGVNYQMLADERIKYKWIVFDFCGRKYISTREYFLKKGKVFQFPKKGFELQIFVPLTELNIKTVKEFEKRKCKQLNLFERPS